MQPVNHERKLRKYLEDILAYWWDAHGELQPGNGGRGKSSNEPSIGLNVAALSFIAGTDILSILHSWESQIRSERKLTPPALLPKLPINDEVHAAVEFQQQHLEWICQQEWLDDYLIEIRDLRKAAMAAARIYTDKVRRIACPADTDDGNCGAMLSLRNDDILGVIACRACGTDWTALRLVKVALADPIGEIWLDAEAIGAWIGVSEHRVRTIARRNEVPRRGSLIELKAFNQARALGA